MSLKKFALGLLLLLGTLPAFAGVQLWANNATTTLSAPASSGATSISVSSSSLFPAPTGGNWFIATLEHIVSGVVTVNEIVKVTNVSGTTWTIVRAQEGTGAVAWLSGDTVALLPTAGGLGQFVQPGLVNGDCTVNGSFAITCTKAGGVALSNGAVTLLSYGQIVGGASTCSITTSSAVESSNLASCTGTTGSYVVNFTTAYSHPVPCTTSWSNAGTLAATITVTAQPSTTSAENVQILNGSGNPITGVVNILCMGT